jgi:hypothetical protein
VGSVEQISTSDGSGYRVRPSDGQARMDLRPAIYGLARAQDWALKELRQDVRTLEAVFNELATSAGEDEK